MILLGIGSERSYAQWTEKDIGSLAWLRSIYFVDDQEGWLVGSKGTIFKTIDSGNKWQKVEWRSTDLIRDVFFSDRETGWILCERDQFSSNTGSASYMMHTTDGGKTWTELESPDKAIKMLRFVYSPTRLALVVGEKGTVWNFSETLKRWVSTNAGTSFLISDGILVSKDRWFLVGGGGTILGSIDEGKTWETFSYPGVQRVKLNAIAALDTRICAVGNRGKIICLDINGTNWTEIASGTENDLFDVKVIGKEKLLAVGDQGTIVTSEDSGSTWKTQFLKGKNRLEKIGVAGRTSYIAGFGKLLESQ